MQADSPRQVIVVRGGDLPQLVDQAEKVIISNSARWGLYQRSGMLVRMARAPERDQKVERSPGAIVLRQATAVMLEDMLTRAIAWHDIKLKEIDCPPKVANVFLSRAGFWRLLTLRGIVNAPILRPDGSILTAPGFDEETGLLLHSSIEWPAPPSLSREAVESAVRCLLEPFAEFPFRSDADQSVLVSGILTALQRRLLESAPAHAFDAPAQGSGKSLLADCVAIIATGCRAASMSANSDEEELRKKLVSILIAGDPVFNLDNVTKPLRSDALATILTLSAYKDRLLGASQIVEIPTNTLVLITGNNLTFSGDMPSRVIISRLEPGVERPEEREFRVSNLRDHILDRRPQLVRAALTILQGYFVAGRPAQGIKPYGRFEQWSKEIREAIIWAGLADPCATRESIIDADPERDATLALFTEWHRAVGQDTTIAKLIQHAEKDTELKAALLEVAADIDHPGQTSPRRLAAWCRNRVGRVVGDFKLEKRGAAHAGFKQWTVSRVSQITKEI